MPGTQQRPFYKKTCCKDKARQVLTGSSEDDGAGLAHLHSREVNELVLPYHDLLYQLTAAQLQFVWTVKR